MKKKSNFEKVINTLLNILIGIFSIVLLISLYTLVQTKFLGKSYADFFGYSMFEVQTGSMAPTIKAGDAVLVKLTKDVKLNDVITFYQDGEYITHRLIEVYKTTYISKGDANNAKDDAISSEQVIGKVSRIFPKVGILRNTIFNPIVLTALIITLFLFTSIFKSSKENGKINNIMNSIKKISAKFGQTKETDNSLNELIIEKNQEVKELENDIKESTDIEIEKTNESSELFTKISGDDANIEELVLDNEEFNDKEDELDKTSFYRVIPVDMDEVNKEFLEIAENEIKEGPKIDEPEVNISTPITIDEEEGLKIDLRLLQESSRRKKSKNVIDKVMNIQQEKLDEISEIIDGESSKTNESTIKDTIIDAYISGRYYSFFNGKSISTKIEEIIREIGKELINEYNGTDYKYQEKVSKYTKMFCMIARLEEGFETIIEARIYKELYRKELIEYGMSNENIENIIDMILNVQRKYKEILEYFLRHLETNMFNLKFNKINNRSNLYATELEHNLQFSSIYSDYIIDKTYQEGIVAEDKVSVLITLLLSQLVKDMVGLAIKRKYIIYVIGTLYKKEKKLMSILKIMDDVYAKENIIILIKYRDLVENLSLIEKLRKMGYKFAISIIGNNNYSDNSKGIFYLADYIFINKSLNKSNLLEYIPYDINKNVICENIEEKVGDFGDE